MNIWFLRMDKDGWREIDLSESYSYIHSAHGSCGDLDTALAHKDEIFPELRLNGKQLAKKIREIKENLAKEEKINLEQSGKRRCDLAIRYWLQVMKSGDLVFVRTKQGTVILCRVTGYISEEFFTKRGCFQRPVQILGEVAECMVPARLWRRTLGRKTIERNARKPISDWVAENYKSLISTS
ncbi:hypothetical protein [Vibrio quintilis]|uniref:Uncharacterized protein n=1 Tax=Vibrio quintilis TaxID=1117707 RepID=A0A1M7YZD8_9VIBR|nr:hypothetical protein [Vibrio quintilis]SHO57955.1 hypothetical protein VQ7734_03725 [Vibrio quintilis]